MIFKYKILLIIIISSRSCSRACSICYYQNFNKIRLIYTSVLPGGNLPQARWEMKACCWKTNMEMLGTGGYRSQTLTNGGDSVWPTPGIFIDDIDHWKAQQMILDNGISVLLQQKNLIEFKAIYNESRIFCNIVYLVLKYLDRDILSCLVCWILAALFPAICPSYFQLFAFHSSWRKF